MLIKKISLAFAAACAVSGAQAAAVVGGSSLLSGGFADQLEAWLGEGAITLTNIYTKQAGDTSTAFHGAVDQRGRTFVVMHATEGNTGNSAVIGGYSKDSWNGAANDYLYDYALGNGDDSFLFNLSAGVRKNQTAVYTTYNNMSYGPAFGGGHDIYVNSSLSMGYSYGHSYGGYTGTSLVDGSGYSGMDMRIGAIEVFTIGTGIPNGVPEPMSLALVGAALAAAAVARRRRA